MQEKNEISFNEVFNSNNYYSDYWIIINNNKYKFIKNNLFSKNVVYKKPLTGVYIIKNIIDNSIYVGSTKDISERLRSHRFYLDHNKHRSKKLQESFNTTNNTKHYFDVTIIFINDREEAFDVEQYLLDLYKDNINLCNIATNAKINRLDAPMPYNVRLKLKQANVGRKQTLEHIEKRVAYARGRPAHENILKRLAIYNATKVVSEETKEKLRQINLGKKHSDETKAKMSLASKGRKMSEEIKQKMSKNHWNNTPLLINGINYLSINDAASKLNLTRKTIRNRLKRKCNNYISLKE